MYLDMGLVTLKHGEVARVDLAAFNLDGLRRQPLRYADRRAEKDGLVFEVVEANDVAPLLGELRQVSDAWLEMKAGSIPVHLRVLGRCFARPSYPYPIALGATVLLDKVKKPVRGVGDNGSAE